MNLKRSFLARRPLLLVPVLEIRIRALLRRIGLSELNHLRLPSSPFLSTDSQSPQILHGKYLAHSEFAHTSHRHPPDKPPYHPDLALRHLYRPGVFPSSRFAYPRHLLHIMGLPAVDWNELFYSPGGVLVSLFGSHQHGRPSI